MTGITASTPGAPAPQDVAQPGTALTAPVQGSPQAPAPMFQQPADFALSVWTSLPPEKKVELLMALQADALPLRDMIDEPLEVEHIVAHRIELVDEKTGEVDEADRIILITPGGEMFACVSKGVRKSVQLLMMAYGMPPWSPPVRVKMNETNTRKGRRLYQLLPADVKVPGKKAAK